MPKIGFSLQSSYCVPMPQVLSLLRGVGFDAVSPAWQPDGSVEEIANCAARNALVLQSLHGPFRGLPDLWKKDETPLLQALLQAVDDCARFRIGVLVVHSWGGLQYTFRREALCFDHFDKLVEYATNLGIRIAFENLEGPEYLAALMARYRDTETVGFCWDSGHELCYTPHRDFLDAYGSRLMMTHLNDNLGVTSPDGVLQGTDDLHLLPFDGVARWPDTVTRLKQAKAQEILNFELKIRPKGDRCKLDLYSAMPLEQYFLKAYETAKQAVSGYFL